MPNGGPDNCGTCGFNRRNSGIWRNPEPDENQTSFCTIRGVAVLADHWIYCQNWHTRTPIPIGPIYSSGIYEQRISTDSLARTDCTGVRPERRVQRVWRIHRRWDFHCSSGECALHVLLQPALPCNGGSGNIRMKKRP